MNAGDATLPPSLAGCQRHALDASDDDELPPWLGQRLRDTTLDIHRAAAEAAQDNQDTTHERTR